MELFVISKEKINFDDLPKTDVRTVSFDKSVLKRYEKDPFQIKLDHDVGVLEKTGTDSWSLQIDAGNDCVTTFLNKLALIPEEERKHFEKHNILPRELSPKASDRWTKGIP
jgi:hypothetical protein